MHESVTLCGPAERTDLILRECAQKTVCETLLTVLGAEPEFLGCSPDGGTHEGFFGIISLIGEGLCLSFILALPSTTAVALGAAFLGFEMAADDPDLVDAVGEITNIFIGDLVARLDEAGVTTATGLPTVAKGRDVDLPPPNGMPATTLAFDCDRGEFWVKLVTAESPTNARKPRSHVDVG